MKATINGVTYDTDKAILVCTDHSESFSEYSTSLYRMEDGRHFVVEQELRPVSEDFVKKFMQEE